MSEETEPVIEAFDPAVAAQSVAEHLADILGDTGAMAQAKAADAVNAEVQRRREDIDLCKRDAIRNSKALAQKAREAITGTEFDGIMAAGWAAKAERARRMLSDPPTASEADIAAVTIEAQVRGKGETALQLAQKWDHKSGLYGKAVAYIDGFLAASENAINACQTHEQLAAVLVQLKSQSDVMLRQFMQGNS